MATRHKRVSQVSPRNAAHFDKPRLGYPPWRSVISFLFKWTTTGLTQFKSTRDFVRIINHNYRLSIRLDWGILILGLVAREKRERAERENSPSYCYIATGMSRDRIAIKGNANRTLVREQKEKNERKKGGEGHGEKAVRGKSYSAN